MKQSKPIWSNLWLALVTAIGLLVLATSCSTSSSTRGANTAQGTGAGGGMTDPLTDDLEGEGPDTASGAAGTSGGAYGTGGSGSGPSTTGQSGSVNAPDVGEHGPVGGHDPDAGHAGANIAGILEAERPTDLGEVLGAVRALNQAEIQVGTMASTRAFSPEVRRFAEALRREHGAANDRIAGLAGGEVRSGELAGVLEQRAGIMHNELQSLSGAEFDHAFLDSQVAIHSNALAMIDQQLIPAASADAAVRSYLQDVRSSVASHLEEARRLLAAQGTGNR